MTITPKKLALMNAEQKTRFILRNLAWSVDPIRARVSLLAEDVGRDPNTVYRWLSAGRVPWHAAQYLEQRYGKKAAPALVLAGRRK